MSHIPIGKEINYITKLERRIPSNLKVLKNEETTDKASYKNIEPVGSRPSILYGLGKMHKDTKYKLAQFLLPFLTPVKMLIPDLLILHWMKLLIFVLKVCITIRRYL